MTFNFFIKIRIFDKIGFEDFCSSILLFKYFSIFSIVFNFSKSSFSFCVNSFLFPSSFFPPKKKAKGLIIAFFLLSITLFSIFSFE